MTEPAVQFTDLVTGAAAPAVSNARCTRADPTRGPREWRASSTGASGRPADGDFKPFAGRGLLSMTVLFTAIPAAGSIVWNREFGAVAFSFRRTAIVPLSDDAHAPGQPFWK